MGQLLLLLVVGLTVAAVVFGVTVLISGSDPGLAPTEPDGRAVPLPGSRPLVESDVAEVRFDTTVRGYRMAQVDRAMRRAAYDIGYKNELIGVLEAEVTALREGRTADAEVLRRAREAALAGSATSGGEGGTGPVAAEASGAGVGVGPDDRPAPGETPQVGYGPVQNGGNGSGLHAGIGIGAGGGASSPGGASPSGDSPDAAADGPDREPADDPAGPRGAAVRSERR